MEFRKANLEAFQKKYGIKLGFMSVFSKAAAYALQDQPVVNAVIDGNVCIWFCLHKRSFGLIWISFRRILFIVTTLTSRWQLPHQRVWSFRCCEMLKAKIMPTSKSHWLPWARRLDVVRLLSKTWTAELSLLATEVYSVRYWVRRSSIRHKVPFLACMAFSRDQLLLKDR